MSENETVDNSQEVTGEAVTSDLEGLQTLFDTLQKERDQVNDQLLRTMADFQNFRKRTQQEQSLTRQYATESLIMTLLPVMDNFERTVKAAENGGSLEALVAGVKAIDKQIKIIVEQQGVTRIESVGKPYDTDLHEALAMVPTEDHEPDTIIEEIEPGYKMGDKVIRHAKVRVATS